MPLAPYSHDLQDNLNEIERALDRLDKRIIQLKLSVIVLASFVIVDITLLLLKLFAIEAR